MKGADLRDARRGNPDREFAVSVPHYPYGRSGGRVGSIVVRAFIEDYKDNRAYVVVPAQEVPGAGLRPGTPYWQPHAAHAVTYALVLDTWDAYCYANDYREAHRMNEQRDRQAAWERERAERRAKVEAWLPAFEGITVPAGDSRRPVKLVDELRNYFIRSESQTYTARVEVFERIAERLR